MRDAVCKNFILDLIRILRENSIETKARRDTVVAPNERIFESGRLIAYNEVISLFQQQAIAFQIPLKELGLENVDPDKDLV
jgi:hypothetical protein